MERHTENELPLGKIFVFWLPLAATWLMMSAEGPFLTAVIARLGDPEHNLAAFGVAFAVAILVEAPIIMIMSASTALVRDRASYLALRNFTFALNAAITLLQLILVTTPAFDLFALRLIGLPPEVAHLTRVALIVFLPWPGAIGYRRFYQGLLIRGGQTRRVAYGTVLRMSTMGLTAIALYVLFDIPGACVGAAAASAGVLAEGVASRLWARDVLRSVEGAEPEKEPLTYRRIARFYWPLALTSTLTLAVQPLITFFVGHANHGLESLAVLPVVGSLAFVFRSMGLSFQEVAIALAGARNEHYRPLRHFALYLGFAASGVLAVIALTPLSGSWFTHVSGLSARLIGFTFVPLAILAAVPLLEVLLSLQRAVLVVGSRTAPITTSAAIEVVAIIAVLHFAIDRLDLVGATAAAIAIIVGRAVCNVALVPSRVGLLRAP